MSAPQGPVNQHKRLKWFGNQLAGVAVGYFLSGIFGGVLGIIGTLLFLFNQGLLQLANWPGLAYVVLGILAFMLVALVFVLASAYVISTFFYGIGYLFSWIFKHEPPKRHRAMAVIDFIAAPLFAAGGAILGWFYGLKAKNAPTPQYTADHAAFKEIFDTITTKTTDPNALPHTPERSE